MGLAGASPLPGGKTIPRLTEPFESESGQSGDSTPRASAPEAEEQKKKKRGLFGFGKKKSEEPSKSSTRADPPRDLAATRRAATGSPVYGEQQPHYIPTSPSRGLASSPRLASPAGSQIFERDVQESSVHLPNSPAIPSHIQTENYIPPVLDASSEAITDNHLDPDSVEIITHTSHQPASVTVTGVGLAEPSWADELAASFSFSAYGSDQPGGDSASNYGSLDNTDVRRLSFISFADVVQAEQQQGPGAGSRDSIHLAGLTSLSSLGGGGPFVGNRSPSPIRSPVSSVGGPGTSPPTSKSGSIKGLEIGGSPVRKPLGSPTSLGHNHGPSPTVSGELSIETMTQALRRTGSGDLSVLRSLPTSPI
ncbi:hypothetical protein B0T25DRAFT_87263 [Lasiosphaeria hispida]|uniref:Uncharacterized protein n=1 Tax=Lasiosphaeria hispida TaxID=260671 RepID=A0AAJ0MHM1_9PEZI|nr:hypothetical protein B0T25DRAFT_87263 [Lasiosphaeria hispida]